MPPLKSQVFFLLTMSLTAARIASAAPLVLEVTAPTESNMGPIKMGTGKTPDGAQITVDATSLLINGKRWTPVMGEFHFSRYDPCQWRGELLKMKAGGIDIVATYVFWIHHEEIEGKFDWLGQRSLRDFVTLCKQTGLLAVVRCGPWAHGECRNGGLPDWLLSKPFRVRSNDPDYLAKVRTLYGEIAGQLQGLLWKDGGPVIGIQHDNEYSGPAEHLLTLKQIAREVGIDVPLYTRTGWPKLGTPMPFGQIIPLFGSYCDGFWDRSLAPMPGNFWQAFVFDPERLDTAASGDRFNRRGGADDNSRYPFLTCEIGGGMEPSYHRRIRVSPQDIYAVPLVKLGSGSNLLGYYMYHGGTQPDGRLSTMQEAQNTAMTNYNDMPVKSYDFQAPLGEFGQTRPHYHLLRRMHLFLHDFGARLAAMPACFPSAMPAGKNDADTLRWAVRSDGAAGFLFVNNYQRLLPMPAKSQVKFDVRLPGGTISIPSEPITIPADSSFFWPLNLDFGGARLIYATAQPICQVDDAQICYTVFAQTPGVPAEFVFDAKEAAIQSATGSIVKTRGRVTIRNVSAGTGAAVLFHTADGRRHCFILLDDKASLACWKGTLGGAERLFLTPANMIFDGDAVGLSSYDPSALSVAILPAPPSLRTGSDMLLPTEDGVFGRFTARCRQPPPVQAAYEQLQPAGPLRQIKMGSQKVAEAPAEADFAKAAVWQVKLPEGVDPQRRLLLRIRYVGDVARVYLNKKLLTDDFYNGAPLEVGINRFAPEIYERGLIVKILPLQRDAPIYLEKEARPDFGAESSVVRLEGVDVVEEHQVELRLK
jgi:beta-galactosidase